MKIIRLKETQEDYHLKKKNNSQGCNMIIIRKFKKAVNLL